jgi:transcriptional regulator with XRE-family HTH domain
MNLKDIKKQQGLTNKDIATSLHCSVSTVGMILQGRHIKTISDTELDALAQSLSITFERCWLAMQESYNEWAGTPGAEHRRFWDAGNEYITGLGLLPHELRPFAEIEGSLVISAERQISDRAIGRE